MAQTVVAATLPPASWTGLLVVKARTKSSWCNAIDTTSAAGRFMPVVLARAAEMERNLTRERTRSAMAVNAILKEAGYSASRSPAA